MLYNRHKQSQFFWIMFFALMFLPFINLLMLFHFLLQEPLLVHKNTKWKVFLLYSAYYAMLYFLIYCVPPSAVYR